jgi:hypothetical protein
MAPAPKVRCQERSGYSCTKIVSLDSPHCGDPSHFPGANGGVSVPRAASRPRAVPLTVSEDYDVIGDTPDLDPVTFNARRVHVSQPALEAWGGHPKALQAKIRRALLRGGYWRTVTGGHLLEFGPHQMVLSSDGRRCESYSRLLPGSRVSSGEPIEALVEPAWDRESVELSARAVRQFTGRHRVDEDQAEDELFDLLDDAADRGKQERAPNGNHRLKVDGFTLTLTPDGATVVSYRTLHAERTPSQVRNKAPSRFQQARRSRTLDWLARHDQRLLQLPPECWIPLAQVPGVFDPGHAWIIGMVVAHDQAEANAVRDAVREALQQAVVNGRWESGQDGRHILECDGRRWTISPDGRGVLGCDPPWPQIQD